MKKTIYWVLGIAAVIGGSVLIYRHYNKEENKSSAAGQLGGDTGLKEKVKIDENLRQQKIKNVRQAIKWGCPNVNSEPCLGTYVTDTKTGRCYCDGYTPQR